MATSLQIKCINKTPRQDPHDRIQNVGGTYSDASRWKLSEPDAIAGIENGKLSFYVSVGGKTVDVIIAKRNGKKYLKTVPDGDHPDNLLSLQECPP